jgi:acetoin utilization deacetylase AcuC-like enzyme
MKLHDLHIAWNIDYVLPLPPGHRFPMEKYELVPGQLLYEGVITSANLRSPDDCDTEDLLRAHNQEYLDKLDNNSLSAREQRLIGFPQTPLMIRRERMITQGTIDCCKAAISHGVALNVAGGTHHAFRDHGEGFCILNDFAVASLHLLAHKRASRILIIDLDVHQGNGTASIMRGNSSVFTFSMHGEHNYPFKKTISDLDIGLRDGTDDETYLQILEKELTGVLAEYKPDFACFVAGVDVLQTDRFGKLGLTLEGCARRDRFVMDALHSLGIPCAISLAGGYSPDIRTIVAAHVNTFKTAIDIYVK